MLLGLLLDTGLKVCSMQAKVKVTDLLSYS